MENFLSVNNVVIYRSPSWSGWTLGLMYSNGLRDDTAKWSKNQHYYGVGLKYDQGPWKSSVILEMETKWKGPEHQTIIGERSQPGRTGSIYVYQTFCDGPGQGESIHRPSWSLKFAKNDLERRQFSK